MQSLYLKRWDCFIRWCEVPGDGPPVVCLPGLSFAAVPNFLPFVLQPGFRGRRMLMVDYVGSGLSGHSDSFGYGLDDHAEAVAAVLEALDCGPVCVLGHSMGGSVGIALAMARPDLVSKLIVCEGNLSPGGGVASRVIAAQDAAEFVASGFAARMADMEQAAREGSAFATFLCGARTGADPRGVHGNARALVELPADFEARFLALPVERHFVYGEETFPKTAGEATADAPDPGRLGRNGVGVHVVPGVGHGLMIEDPAAAAQILTPLL